MPSGIPSTPSQWFDDPSTLLSEVQREARRTRLPIEIDGYDQLVEVRRGGQGVVYRSVQKSTGRDVAIKVLLDGALASSASARRFEREVDLVASLRHPNIVSIYDSGTTDEGRQYLVMEFVDGLPLDEAVTLCPKSRADVSRVVSLVAKTCDAIHFAHQHGIMHRDLKPSNVRVDRRGEPRILDFGLAKGFGEAEGTSKGADAISRSGNFFGSLAWASPEQAEGSLQRIDVRTDVYSLGMMLYYLLTGAFPYEVQGRIREVLDNIVMSEPAPLRSHNSIISADLETITLKALSKDPERRYQSARELAEDLRRFEAGEPIEARRDSTWYVLKRNLKRYRMLAGAAVAILILTIAYGVTMSILYRDANEAQKIARTQAERAGSINRFLQSMLSSVDAENEGYQVKVADVLAGAVAQLQEDSETPATIRASLYQTLGSSYQSLGRYSDAEPLMRKSVELFEESDGDVTVDLLSSRSMLARILFELDRLDEAAELFEEVIEETGIKDVPDQPVSFDVTESNSRDDVAESEIIRMGLSAITELARVRYAQGRRDEAISLATANIKRQKAMLGDNHFDTLGTMNMLGGQYQEIGRFDEARKLLGDVSIAYLKKFGSRHPKTLAATSNSASLLVQLGEYAEAEKIFRNVLEIQLEDIGEEHADTLITLNNLADVTMELGDVKEAEAAHRRVLRISRKVLGPENQNTLITENNLARTLHHQGQLEEAERLFREVLEIYTRTKGEDHPATLLAMGNLSGVLEDKGEVDESERLARQVVSATRRTLGDETVQTLIAMNNLASQLRDKGQHEEAVRQYTEALDISAKMWPDGNWLPCVFEGGMAQSLIALEEFDRAETLLLHAFECLRDTMGIEYTHTQKIVSRLAELYELQEQPERRRVSSTLNRRTEATE
ncbi:MAG: tetratricopeptide repeat protein [Phycisphaerae bacterium]